MFEHLTNDARQVLSLAKSCARMLKHDTLGVEHVLLALADQGKGLVAEVLFALNVCPRDLWTQTKLVTGAGPAATPGEGEGNIPFSLGAKRVLAHSMQQSRYLNQNYIGPEHLLLGLLAQLDDPWVEPEIAGEILERLGVKFDLMRQELLSRVTSY